MEDEKDFFLAWPLWKRVVFIGVSTILMFFIFLMCTSPKRGSGDGAAMKNTAGEQEVSAREHPAYKAGTVYVSSDTQAIERNQRQLLSDFGYLEVLCPTNTTPDRENGKYGTSTLRCIDLKRKEQGVKLTLHSDESKPAVKWMAIQYRDGKQYGDGITWDYNGEIVGTSHLKNGDGEIISWWDFSTKKKKIEIKTDGSTKVTREWHENGKMQQEAVEVNKELVRVRTWDENGNLTMNENR